MKLSINTSFTENTSSQFLLILVDSENTQHLANAYQINDLNNLIEATQFKAQQAPMQLWSVSGKQLNYKQQSW